MTETQQSINDWQKETFPSATYEGVLKHLFEEFEEFKRSPDEEEAADIVIILYCWAMHKGIDLMGAVDEKMRVNRLRQWNIQPDGTGRHQ